MIQILKGAVTQCFLFNVNCCFFNKGNFCVSGAEDDVHHFTGNDSHTDYFRLMLRDGDSLLIGGR